MPRIALGLLVALLLSACGSTPGRYYETTGLLHRPIAADERAALVATVLSNISERPVVVVALDGTRRAVPRGELAKLPVELLQALHLTTASEAFEGAEIDLLVQTGKRRMVPVAVYLERDAAIELHPGEPGSLPRVEAKDDRWFGARYTVGRLRERDAKWDAYARHTLDLALARLDRAEGEVVRDMPFIRAKAARGSGDRGAQYTQENCRAHVSVYDRAFAARGVQFIGPVAKPLPGPVMALLHEVGHAIHNRPGRLAFCHYEWLVDDRNRRAAKLGERIDAFNARVKRANAGDAGARAEVQRLKGSIGDEQAAVAALDERIGEAFAEARRMTRGGPVIDAYLAAVGAGASPTDYGRQSETESFAEAFALFRADPAALRRALPEAHAFFARGGHIEAIRSAAPAR